MPSVSAFFRRRLTSVQAPAIRPKLDMTRSTRRAGRTSTDSGFPGPFNPTGPGDTPSRRRIFVCRPVTGAEEEPCARRIISTLARRAYRGQVTAGRPAAPARLLPDRRREEQSFEAGIQIRAAAPARQPEVRRFASSAIRPPSRQAAIYRISDLDLASRLSFFLWSIDSRRTSARSRAAQAQAADESRCSSSRCGACSPIRDRRRS